MRRFVNLLFMLLATLTGGEMDIFCISPEQALNQHGNSEFAHSNTASRLLHEGGTRPGWKATPPGPAAIAARPEAAEPGRTIEAGCVWQRRCTSSLVVPEIRSSLFSVTRLSHCLPGLLPGRRTQGTGQSCSLLHHSPSLVRISTIQLNILLKWKITDLFYNNYW